MNPAVHGTTLWVLLGIEALIIPCIIVGIVAYVRIALAAGKGE